MVKTESVMNSLYTLLRNFKVQDVITGNWITHKDYEGCLTVYMFICNHCPFVKWVLPELIQLSNDYKVKGVKFLAISSNDVVNYPADHPDLMKRIAI